MCGILSHSLTVNDSDKHGQLGIWDARAPVEEIADEDGDVTPDPDAEGGKYWRLQMHWPATSKSSISSIKFDPIDAFSVRASTTPTNGLFMMALAGLHQCLRLQHS